MNAASLIHMAIKAKQCDVASRVTIPRSRTLNRNVKLMLASGDPEKKEVTSQT